MAKGKSEDKASKLIVKKSVSSGQKSAGKKGIDFTDSLGNKSSAKRGGGNNGGFSIKKK